jgi:DNA-binding NarL/FixJ family response regulator
MVWNRSCGTSWEVDCDPSQGEDSCKAKRKDNMLNVLLYTTQPILALGLAAALEASNCRLARVCCGMPGLREALARTRFDVLLIEATPELSTEMLSELNAAAQGAPIVIWVDPVSTEFVAQALSLGVRGVLRKNLSAKLQVRCLETVGAGELWVEKEMVASLLRTKRIVLGERERQLVTLLAQGLKNKEIGYRLGLSEGTVKVYLSRLFQKVGASDRFALALYAIENVLDNRCSSAGSEVPARPIASATRIPGALLAPEAGMTHHRLGSL